MRLVWTSWIWSLTVLGPIGLAAAQGSALEQLGEHDYMSLCASCHGVAGRGDGPVAATLTVAPTDLTRLSQKNNGLFPFARTYEIIDGRGAVAAHGTRDMPVWGDVFGSTRASALVATPPYSRELYESIARARILALIEYISTLQAK